MEKNNTRFIVEGGVSIALSFILSFVVLFKMPLGGSVTLASRLPIVIFAIRWGVKKGLWAALIFGVLNLLTATTILHPAQALLDYILSFSAIAISGISFGKSKSKFSYIPSIIISYLVSGAFNVISAFIFFNDMATAKAAGFTNFTLYAFAYNYSFLSVDALILIVVFLLIFDRLKAYLNKQN
ncbi:energy-coupled thiamine transporter ThiT [Anaerococcus ihuae]|uniref:energy-coupled thiamine transporter ThiT n=1 Tax=Anaerococcus ihuae TaxID=2899519 RepID=UPI001EFFFB97|nr:energy-coupled thiamine transporter ThiT [Anaerococcus ihuae]